MSKITFKGQEANTSGDLPKTGQTTNFSNLIKSNLAPVSIDVYAGKYKVLNIFPSIDTAICAMSVRKFNQEAANLKNTVVLCISADLPFAHARFCGAEGISNCETLSTFRSDFGKEWGLTLLDTPLAGLLARAVVILSPDNKVLYTELVSEITKEPDYELALKAIR